MAKLTIGGNVKEYMSGTSYEAVAIDHQSEYHQKRCCN